MWLLAGLGLFFYEVRLVRCLVGRCDFVFCLVWCGMFVGADVKYIVLELYSIYACARHPILQLNINDSDVDAARRIDALNFRYLISASVTS